jgi:hypothetical protein
MNGFTWSKTPLKMLFILFIAGAINFGLILGIQMITNYRMEGPVDAAALARLDEQWNGCEILDHKQDTSRQNLYFYLVKQDDGSMHFVTLKKHYLFDRYRVLAKACQSVPENGEPLPLKAGTCQMEVTVDTNNRTGESYMKIDSTFMGQHAGQQFKNQMILSIAGLCILELTVWCLVFRKEEIA